MIVDQQASTEPLCEAILRAMAKAIAHRGPDAEGTWVDTTGTVGLAHRRLSIMDLSPAGAQPMQSHNARFTITFNGEIYNHLSLRSTLANEGHHVDWRGHSDTETILEAITHWGLPEALKRTAGMFALALWDASENTLSLARDRMGEKPLHFAHIGTFFAFASELKAIHAVPGFDPKINQAALSHYLAHSVVSDSQSIYSGVQKVRPGSILEIAPDSTSPTDIEYETFDQIVEEAKKLRQRKSRPNLDETAIHLETVLEDVIDSQTLSDVPLGSFLSGGIDSSLITALMKRATTGSVKSFCIGFTDVGYDESPHAEAVARHLDTEHKTYLLSEQDALELVPTLPLIYDEPFADSSQIPTLLLCQKARKEVTVALTGDGGDEVFAGYNRHIFAPRAWNFVSKVPPVLRQCLKPFGNVLESFSKLESNSARALAAKMKLPASTLNKFGRLSHLISVSDNLVAFHQGLTRQMDEPEQFLKSKCRSDSEGSNQLASLSPLERMLVHDSKNYLSSDILVKVDRAAMSASLETRAPFLDPRILRAAWNIGDEHKVAAFTGKAVLRNILDRHVPNNLIERPKQGFAVPIDRWLRGELKSWAEDLLSPEKIEAYGVLHSELISQLWSVHLSGRRNHGQALWNFLMLQGWLEHQFDKNDGCPPQQSPSSENNRNF